MEITTYASPSAPNISESDSSMPSSTRPVKIIHLQHPDTESSSSSFSGSYPSVLFSRWTLKLRRLTWPQWIGLFLPCYRWINTYRWREYFQIDLMAGITVGIMLVPQVILPSSISFIFLLLLGFWRKETESKEEKVFENYVQCL
jgi:sulfate transporter 4